MAGRPAAGCPFFVLARLAFVPVPVPVPVRAEVEATAAAAFLFLSALPPLDDDGLPSPGLPAEPFGPGSSLRPLAMAAVASPLPSSLPCSDDDCIDPYSDDDDEAREPHVDEMADSSDREDREELPEPEASSSSSSSSKEEADDDDDELVEEDPIPENGESTPASSSKPPLRLDRALNRTSRSVVGWLLMEGPPSPCPPAAALSLVSLLLLRLLFCASAAFPLVLVGRLPPVRRPIRSCRPCCCICPVRSCSRPCPSETIGQATAARQSASNDEDDSASLLIKGLVCALAWLGLAWLGCLYSIPERWMIGLDWIQLLWGCFGLWL